MKCNGPVNLIIKKHSVFYSNFDVVCSKCNIILGSEINDVYTVVANGKMVNHDKRTLGAVYGQMLNGGCHKALGDMSLGFQGKALCRSQYHKYKNVIIDNVIKVTDEHFQMQAARVCAFYINELKIYPDENGILDIEVTFDGSWKTHGHNSTLGTACLLEAHTGIPLDYEAYSRKCYLCTVYENRLEKGIITQ